MDRITSMQVFARAVSAGSLSAAARQLDMSPAVATKHVDALEAHLGVKLLHRTTRRLSLTEAGSDYLDACLRLLPEIEEAEAAAASQRIEVRGLLRITMPLSFGRRYIAPLLPAFSQLYPALRIELGLSDSVVDLLDGGCREWVFGPEGKLRVPISGDLAANNGDALLAAAIAGQGVIYQPLFIVADALERGKLVALQLDQPAHMLGGIHAVYPPDRRPPAKVRAMLDYLIEVFEKEPLWRGGVSRRVRRKS